MNEDNLADDENDTPVLPANRTHDESSATASVGDTTEEAKREPAQIQVERNENVVEAGIDGDQQIEHIPQEYTNNEMIHISYSLGNKPEGTGPSPHLASNLATEGRLAKLKDKLKEDNVGRPQAMNVEPLSEGRDYETQAGTLQTMPAQDEDPNSRSANTFVCDSAVQKTLELQQLSEIYTHFDAFNREQANERAKMLPKKAPPPQLPKLTDTLPPSNTAVIQRNSRLAGIAKPTVILRPPQKPPQTEAMDTTEDRATSSNKPATIKEEVAELDNWFANFSGVAAAEEPAQKATTRPLTLENIAAATG